MICSAAVPLAVASVAWACASLATLKLSTRAAAPAESVSGTGTNYNPAYMVTVRFNSRTGPVLWEGLPNPVTRKLEPTFKVPSVAPGYYTILATQNDPTGKPYQGTPGRAPLEVRAAGSSSEAPPAFPSSSSKPTGPGGSGAPLALDPSGSGGSSILPTLAGVLLSLSLLGSGLALVSLSRSRAPARSLGV